MTKYDFLKWLGKADIVVDDNPDNVKLAGNLGIHAFMVPKPWNDSHISLSLILDTLAKTDPN
jgi:hypothetical protein